MQLCACSSGRTLSLSKCCLTSRRTRGGRLIVAPHRWVVVAATPCSLIGALVGQTPSRTTNSRPLSVVITEPPSWWIPAHAPDSDVYSPGPNSDVHSLEGPLYFRAVLQNPNAVSVSVDVSFQSYLSDGTRYEGCYAPGGGGAGVTTEIASHGRALVTCHRATVPLIVKGLQVTMRKWSVTPVTSTSHLAAVVEAGLMEGEHFPYTVNWDAYAHVRSRSSRDVDVRLFFRFLSADSLQVATCESDDLHVEREVALRANCSTPVDLPNGTPRPISVLVDVRRPN